MSTTPNPMFAKFDQALGAKTPTTGQPKVTSRADEIRALAKQSAPSPAQSQPTAPQGSPQNPSTFNSPLQNIASGNSQTNLEHTKGAYKQGLSDFLSAGAQNAGPIGADMLAHAPAFAAQVNAGKESLQPKNAAQAQGAMDTSLAEMALPTSEAAKSVDAGALLHPVDKLKGYADSSVKAGIQTDVTNLLKATRAVSNKSADAAKAGTDLRKVLADPQVFKGIKVEGTKINPDEAIQTIQDRIDPLMEAKRGILPNIDRIVPTTPKSVIIQKAIDEVSGKSLPADEAKLVQAIKDQAEAWPDQLKPSEIDALRAQARNSARDAKGQMKSSNEYAAIENAARDTVFDITDKLPVANAGEYKALNDYVKQMITTKDFLDKTLRNQVVKGGRLKGFSLKLLGSIAGSSHGPLGALVGHGVGGVVADIVTNNQLGSSFKMSLIKNLTDDPAILKQAEKLLGDIKEVPTPALPPGNPAIVHPTVNDGKPIQAMGAGPSEYVGPDTRAGSYQASPKILDNTQLDASKNTISPSTNNIELQPTTNAPKSQELQQAVNNHLTSAEQVLKENPKTDMPGLIEQTRNNIADGIERQGFKDVADKIRSIDLSAFKDWESFKNAIVEYVKNAQPGLSMKNVGPDPLKVAQKIGGEDVKAIQDFMENPNSLDAYMKLQPLIESEKLDKIPHKDLPDFFQNVIDQRNSPNFSPAKVGGAEPIQDKPTGKMKGSKKVDKVK